MSAEILDWRGAGPRLAAALWGADGNGRWWLRAASALTSPLQRAALRRRVAARGAPPPAVLVVSIGNLRVGGTGKTPVTAALAAALAGRGIPGAIVTRGFGSALAGPLRVRPDDLRAAEEARLLAAAVPGWSVVQARDRAAGVAAAREAGPAIVLLEDGHQTAGVARHLDVLILDRWRRHDTPDGVRIEPLAGPLLPWGPYREGIDGAARARCWLVEIPPGDTASRFAGALPPGGPAGAVLGFRRVVTLPADAAPSAGAPYAVLSGIARPERFEAACARLLGREPCLAIRCADHAPYSGTLVARALAAGRARGVAAWLTTPKDAIKLGPLWTGPEPLRVVSLAIDWVGTRTLPDLVGERLGTV